MVIKVNEELIKDNILEFETSFTIINEQKSFAFISTPYKQIKKLGWNKQTRLKITIKELK